MLEIKNNTGEVIAICKPVPKPSATYTTGAILVDSWGWEQTNIDFYVIIERKGDFVTVQKLLKDRSPKIGFMSNHVRPTFVPDLKEKPIRKKVKIFDGKEAGFTFRNYSGGGWCSLWKGEKVTETHYA
jgi:hypothetical protein